MAEERAVTNEQFTVLLAWLDADRDSAASKYETIRRRLIKILVGRGCFEADMLADRIIDRVALKAPELNGSYIGDPALYFYGVANYVFHEWLRKQKNIHTSQKVPEDVEVINADREGEYRCLERCLEALPIDAHQLIVDYYHGEKGERIENRRLIAERLGISMGALQIKASRIRNRLSGCVRECINCQNGERY